MMIAKRHPMIRDMEKFMREYASTRSNEKKEAGFMPPADIWHDNENVYVEVELPGMKKDDINIKVDDEERTLTISGNKEYKGEEKDRCCRSERLYGNFFRQFYLGKKVNPDSIKAHYENGILAMSVSKHVPETKEIEIK
jgi:HSP20 family protein